MCLQATLFAQTCAGFRQSQLWVEGWLWMQCEGCCKQRSQQPQATLERLRGAAARSAVPTPAAADLSLFAFAGGCLCLRLLADACDERGEAACVHTPCVDTELASDTWCRHRACICSSSSRYTSLSYLRHVSLHLCLSYTSSAFVGSPFAPEAVAKSLPHPTQPSLSYEKAEQDVEQ